MWGKGVGSFSFSQFFLGWIVKSSQHQQLIRCFVFLEERYQNKTKLVSACGEYSIWREAALATLAAAALAAAENREDKYAEKAQCKNKKKKKKNLAVDVYIICP